ncbi:autotransporter outer membrane beta-barrel domain-containing protein [Mucilaginibacter sp.]|jgi:hypothetical protein|uniref:autotransporter outer membrane beta-barrel domain-containing protein n=1 Tax=Mucilaginibacter sp. TaxID=1882438 RepID=UPI00356587AC
MYKKLLLVFVSIITINAAKAQTEKGNQSVGLSFGLSTTDLKTRSINYSTNDYDPEVKGKQNNYTISPNYSYFIADKLDIGLAVGYSYSSQKYDTNMYSPQNQSGKSFFSSIRLRKYFLYDNKIGIRTGPHLSYQRLSQSYTYNINNQPNYNTNSNVYTGGVGLDFVYYPIKKLGLTAAMGNLDYQHQKSSGNTSGTYNSFNLSFANSLIFSVNYIW